MPSGLQEIPLILPNGAVRPFFHRGSRSDLGAITQIFSQHDYSLDRLQRQQDLLDYYAASLEAGKTPLIIDAGANIGAAAVWFATMFPLAHVIAFEPDADNFRLLALNGQGLAVTPVQAAVGGADGRAALLDPGQGEWGYRTRADPDGACAMVALARVVAEQVAAGFAPFIAKIDIEGGEDELFRHDTGWVSDFPLLIVELHDWLMPKAGTSRSFLRCVAGLDRDFVHINENVFSVRNW